MAQTVIRQAKRCSYMRQTGRLELELAGTVIYWRYIIPGDKQEILSANRYFYCM